MSLMSSTALIFPCDTVAQRLDQDALYAFAYKHPHIHMFFVDNASQDETLSLLRILCSKIPGQMHIVHLPKKRSLAEVLRQGVLSTAHIDFEYIGFWKIEESESLSHILSYIDLLDTQKDTHVILGSRIRLLGNTHLDETQKHYLNRLSSICASLWLDTPIYDAHCRAKLFRNNQVFQTIFQKAFTTSDLFDIEILDRISREYTQLAQHVIETPIRSWRTSTSTTISPIRLTRIGLQWLQLVVQRSVHSAR